jgi:hypothetical protein
MSNPTAPVESPAERIAETDVKGASKGVTPANAKPAKPPRFDLTISAAVKMARTEMHSKKPGRKDGQHVGAASGGDHIRVREVVTERVGTPVTVEKILKASGIKSVAALRRIAEFDPAEDMTGLRELGKAFKDDKNKAWRTGRYLAGILAAWAIQLAEAEKAAKKASKKS